MTGLATLAMSGCGNQYRPVVSAINPVGPAGQPTKYAVAVSNTSNYGSAPLPGLVTFVDVSGDTILSTPSILPFPAPTTPGTATTAPTPTYVNPLDFTINLAGTEGFVVNSSGAFDLFPLGNPTTLLTQNITQTTLASNAVPNGIQTFSLPSTGTTLFVNQPSLNQIAELELSTGPSLLQNLSVPNPVYVVGTDSAQRVYALSSNGASAGTAYPIENTPVSIDSGNLIPVGVNPVYGMMTADGNRAFVLNQGNGTISVINVPNNGLDTGVGAGPNLGTIVLPTPAGSSAPNPVWADLSTVNSELVVLNQGDGVHPGSLSIINIPLCNVNTPVTNPDCDPANPVDAAGFGNIVATVPVGVNPTEVSVLADGSRAYVVNSGTLPSGTSAGVEGSVSVVNLINEQVTTIPATSAPAATVNVSTSPTMVYGHPNTVAATTGTPTGKVYVTSTDNKYMTIIETDTDTVDTHISLQGLGIRVMVTAK